MTKGAAGPAASDGVALVLLAAGRSRRFGAENKLLAEIDGEPLVRRVARALTDGAPGATLILVVGHEATAVAEAVGGLADVVVENPDAGDGIATSIRSGIAAVPPEAAGALIAQADMPELPAGLVGRLVTVFGESEGRAIVHPVRADGRQGNPVLWPRDFFPELARLTGDTGAKPLLAAHAALCRGIPLADDRSQIDLDTQDAYRAWLASRGT